MGTGYYNRGGEEISREESYGLWEDIDKRRVAQTDIGDINVSTVHLILDHQYGDGPPLIFETMIFGGEHDQECWRYATEAMAVAGHERVVAALEAGEDPWEV